ncbi:MAG: serine hydrolase [Alphaproteobacteria bacterium]|nr:serine hydrolase [Alphaproteobacteria bacterium]
MMYFPEAGHWETVVPGKVGATESGLEKAVAYHVSHESPWHRDLEKQLLEGNFEPPPLNEVIGPVAPRGGPAGMILKGGRQVASWGDVDRADFTFSVAKSCLAMIAGLLHQDGLLPDIDKPVRELIDDGGFDSDQNALVTWRHLMEQTSEWEGELFGKPDFVDRNRDLNAKPGEFGDKGALRPLEAPGTFWEYNDVRVNRLSLSLLRLAKRNLPELFKERILDPIGGSSLWRWHGYRNSTVIVDDTPLTSVPGGTHWGGGLQIPTTDLARLGLLALNKGAWGGAQLIGEDWYDAQETPCSLNQTYGLLWWLNTDRKLYPAAPESSVFMLGAGSNIVWIDRPMELVVVARWIDKQRVNGFVAEIMKAFGKEK